MDEIGEVHIIAEDNFVDIDLPMASYQHRLNGVQDISARGRHRGADIGFLVSLGPIWERQDLDSGDFTVYWGRAELVSLGTESDAFLRFLDEAYGTRLGHKMMRQRVPFLVASLNGDPARVEHEPAKLKFFFESDAEDRDADFYVNIDVQARSVQFHEKDTDCGRGIVLALSTKT